MKILFITWHNHNCGVHQYGKIVAEALQAIHVPVNSMAMVDEAIARIAPDVTIWNWHPATLGQLVHPLQPRRYTGLQVALMHELDPNVMAPGFFDAFVMPDPTCQYASPVFYTCGRVLVDYVNPYPMPTIPTIGTFGFGVGIKGYERLVGYVQDGFDEAIIRVHIPANWAVDPQGAVARQAVNLIQACVTKNIVIEASHDWLSDEMLLDWLAKNSVNVFPYHPTPHTGISSSTDWALAVGRPVAITHCGLFKHLHHLPICLEDHSLRQIVARGLEPIRHLREMWTKDAFRARWQEIFAQVRQLR